VSRDIVVTDLVRQQARQLKMPGTARAFEALARQARDEKWSFECWWTRRSAEICAGCAEPHCGLRMSRMKIS